MTAVDRNAFAGTAAPQPSVLDVLDGFALPGGWLEAGLAALDAKERVVAANDALAAWLGRPLKELVGRPFWELLWQQEPEWEAAVLAAIKEAAPLAQLDLKRQEGGRAGYYRLELGSNPAGRWLRLCSVLPPQGEIIEASCEEYLHGAAQRQVFIRALRAEAQLESMVHRWPGIIFSQRADFSFHFASPAIEELTGVLLRDLRSQPQRFWQLMHEADGDEFQQHIKRCIQQKRGHSTTFRLRHAKTGRVAYLLEHRQAILSANGLVLGYEGVWLDVTRQIIAEKRLSSAAWKETLAVLTMGLAHDFSNIMAGILSLSESFLAQLETTHPFHEGLTLIRQNSLAAHQLVHRIINLHHGKTGSSHYCDLNQLLSELVDLVKKILPRRVTVAMECSSEALPLYVDSVEFRQVIINLTLNAAEAMPQGGRLALRTSRHGSLPALATFRGTLPRPPAVCLEVADNGCGIKARHIESIFDPFFTTKSLNKGSGLGLYNTRLFVEKHRGAVSVESTEGAGTTFRIWLPEADFTEGERGLAETSARRRSLLVAGRADGPLESTAEFLRCHGYHVVLANNEQAAMDLMESVDYQFAGLMVVVEPRDMALCSLIAHVRHRKLPLKTVLQVVACHPDELDTHILQKTDVLISPDMPQAEILERLDHGLPEPAYEPMPAL